MKKSSKSDIKNGVRTWKLWGIPLFSRGMSRVLNLVEDQINSNNIKPNWQAGRPFWIATVNPEFVMEALKDGHFFEILQKTNLNVMDGVGLIWAKALNEKFQIPNNNFQTNHKSQNPTNKLITGIKIGLEIMQGQHREILVPGVELMDRMCEMAARKNKLVCFYGGWGDRAARTADYFLAKYPELKVAGFTDENFDFNIETDFLFVARGMKKQEEWINTNLDKLKCKVVMGVGRSFDYYSGDLKRAPEKIRKLGLEWAYSLYKEPKRWKRQLALPMFVIKILRGI